MLMLLQRCGTILAPSGPPLRSSTWLRVHHIKKNTHKNHAVPPSQTVLPLKELLKAHALRDTRAPQARYQRLRQLQRAALPQVAAAVTRHLTQRQRALVQKHLHDAASRVALLQSGFSVERWSSFHHRQHESLGGNTNHSGATRITRGQHESLGGNTNHSGCAKRNASSKIKENRHQTRRISRVCLQAGISEGVQAR